EEFATLVGLWIADGSYDKNSIIFSVVSKEERDLVEKITKRFNLGCKKHSDGVSLMINSELLKDIFTGVLGLKGNAYTKRIPEWVFNLHENEIKGFLRGYVSGDGWVRRDEVAIRSSSLGLLKDLQTLFLKFEIILRVSKNKLKDNTYEARISGSSLRNFLSIGFLQDTNNKKLKSQIRKNIHDVSDIVPLPKKFYSILKKSLKQEVGKKLTYNTWVNWHRKYLRGSNIGRHYFQEIVRLIPNNPHNVLHEIAFNDIFWDKIISISEREYEGYVYDISVPENENFICENIVAHNTRELRLVHEHWVPGLARVGFGMPLPTGEKYGAVSLFDLLRESFRQAPDYVVVGETRGSVRGNEEVVVIENGIMKRLSIKELENKDWSKLLVPTLDKDMKISIKPLNNFIKHSPRKNLLEVKTRSGRRIVVTPDHSLFIQNGFDVTPIKTEELKIGDRILIPSFIPSGFNDIKFINLVKLLPDLRLQGVQKIVKTAIKNIGQAKANKICGCVARQYCRNVDNRSIPIKTFEKLLNETDISMLEEEYLINLKVRSKGSRTFPTLISVNEEFCRFLGYYVAEGYYTNNSVIITNSNPPIIEDVVSIVKNLFGISPSIREVSGKGKSNQIIISHIILVKLIKALDCGRTSKEKRIPAFIYGLSKKKISQFLRGLYSGDGSFYCNEVEFTSSSRQLVNDLLYLLLTLGIVARFEERGSKYRVRFKRIADVERFLREVGFVHKNYTVKKKGAPRSTVNIIKLPREIHFKLPRPYRHLKKCGQCSKYYFEKIVKKANLPQHVKKFAQGEFFLDEIKEIHPINLSTPEPVYDLSVNPSENFIGGFGGIILHNSEAYVMFQGMAAGHPCMSTFHAGSIDTTVKRLTTPPIELSPTLMESLNVIVILTHAKEKGPTARRVREAAEIVSVDPRTGEVSTNLIFRWNPTIDEIEKIGDSVMLRRIAATTGARIEDVISEVERKKAVLDWLKENGISDYIDVCEYINRYYKNPEEVMAEIMAIPKIKPPTVEKPRERISFWQLLRLARRGK
ncbi:MAG: LAGLIDADG family homing endonuclease, partial [Candidatus Aenigmarchaeota archaeon]|nr:LAGLIDADG family homing endonuclease [Candidatus Aenigmarchaeota archaeon]